MKRLAYIGLSGPLCYDYEIMNQNYPNPILEAPLGLLTFYDEVVFLHESLCPKSIQNLDFVRILSDSVDIKDYFEQTEKLNEVESEYKANNRMICDDMYAEWDRFHNQFHAQYDFITNTIGPSAVRADTHSMSLKFGKYHVTPNSMDRINVAYDNFISAQQGLSLVTNSAINGTLTSCFNAFDKGIVTNRLLAKRIPNYTNEEGPDVEIIENIRKRRLMKEFREKIDNIVETQDYKSIDEYSETLEEEFHSIRNELANRTFEKTRIYNSIMSIAKVLLSEGMRVIPGLGIGISAYEIGKEIHSINRDKKMYGWTGLLIDLERMT